jgi:protein gp37
MADKSKIEWTEATWNPVTGCSKVSQGCKNCYAEREWPRLSAPRPNSNIYTGRKFTDVQTHPDRLEQPLLWKKPRMIFVNSMSDLFHEDVSDGFIADVFNVMAEAKQHTFQVLTKRAERMRDFFCGTSGMGCGGLFMPNVWLGVSVEDQATANERIPFLLDIQTHVRWISAEPLLGPIDLTQIVGASGETWNVLDRQEAEDAAIEGGCDGIINWVVAGGESGPHARPMHPEWVRSLRDQCAAAEVPFFFKQWGEWAPRSACYHTLPDGKSFADLDPGATRWPCTRLTESGGNGHSLEDCDGGDDAYMQRVGKTLAGNLLDGVEHKEFPEIVR